MSLKAFHVVFLAASVLLMLVLSGWCFQSYRATGDAGLLAGGVACLLGALGLFAYGCYFLKKLKHISYL
jgi:hypothetical protein